MMNAHKLVVLVCALGLLYKKWMKRRKAVNFETLTDADRAWLQKKLEAIYLPHWGQLPPEPNCTGKGRVSFGVNVGSQVHARRFQEIFSILSPQQQIALLLDVERLRAEETEEAEKAWQTIFGKEPRIRLPAFTRSKDRTVLQCHHYAPSHVEGKPTGFWMINADASLTCLFVSALIPEKYQMLQKQVKDYHSETTYWLP